MAMTLIISFILLFVWIGAFFDYYTVERNEIYHKKGIFAEAERFPVKSLRLKKEIPDVFEFFKYVFSTQKNRKHFLKTVFVIAVV